MLSNVWLNFMIFLFFSSDEVHFKFILRCMESYFLNHAISSLLVQESVSLHSKPLWHMLASSLASLPDYVANKGLPQTRFVMILVLQWKHCNCLRWCLFYSFLLSKSVVLSLCKPLGICDVIFQTFVEP